MKILYDLAMQHLLIPYVYGGKIPIVGLDCSGLVCELLHAVGAFPSLEANAQGIHDYFITRSTKSEVGLGALAFYGKSEKEISHVGMLLDTHMMIEAGHGDSSTTSIEIAKSRGAYVRLRPFNYRKDLVTILRPDYQGIGLEP